MKKIRLTPQTQKDLKTFEPTTFTKIKAALRHLASHPLEGNKGKFKKEKVRSYRVWPYRILYCLIGSEWLDVLSIEHRKDVYR